MKDNTDVMLFIIFFSISILVVLAFIKQDINTIKKQTETTTYRLVIETHKKGLNPLQK